MSSAGVSKSVTMHIPVSPDSCRYANDKIEEMVASNKNLIPFALVDPRSHGTEIHDGLGKWLGIKLHPLAHGYCVDHPIIDPFFDYIEELGLPIIIHSGWGEHGRSKYIEGVARAHPHVTVIMAHMVEVDCLDVVGRNSNMYIDTSYAPHPRRVEQAVRICGEDRILLGSDYPYGNQAFEVAKVEMTDLSREVKDKILGGNIRRILNE